MKPMRESSGREWMWTRPRVFRRRWELRPVDSCGGDELLATLESRHAFGWTMTGETAECRWQLRHFGLLRGHVVLTSRGDALERALFLPGWFGAGAVRCDSGLALRWHRADVWGRRWQLVDADDSPLLTFTREASFFRSTTAVEVADAARERAELPALVLLGFYLVVLMQRQSHAS